MRRSARLVSRRFWMVLGLALLSVLVELLFETAIGVLPTLLTSLFGHRGDRLGAARRPSVILTQLDHDARSSPAITVLIYLDLRVRTEGLDLELDAIEAFPTAA